MQYAAVVVGVCIIGYIIAGFTENWWLTLIICIAILTAILLAIGKKTIPATAASK